jgi:hypothetical protein
MKLCSDNMKQLRGEQRKTRQMTKNAAAFWGPSRTVKKPAEEGRGGGSGPAASAAEEEGKGQPASTEKLAVVDCWQVRLKAGKASRRATEWMRSLKVSWLAGPGHFILGPKHTHTNTNSSTATANDNKGQAGGGGGSSFLPLLAKAQTNNSKATTKKRETKTGTTEKGRYHRGSGWH